MEGATLTAAFKAAIAESRKSSTISTEPTRERHRERAKSRFAIATPRNIALTQSSIVIVGVVCDPMINSETPNCSIVERGSAASSKSCRDDISKA